MLKDDDFVDLSLAVCDYNFKPQPVKGVIDEFIKVDKESGEESSKQSDC